MGHAGHSPRLALWRVRETLPLASWRIWPNNNWSIATIGRFRQRSPFNDRKLRQVCCHVQGHLPFEMRRSQRKSGPFQFPRRLRLLLRKLLQFARSSMPRRQRPMHSNSSQRHQKMIHSKPVTDLLHSQSARPHEVVRRDSAGGGVGMLEVIESDFARLEADTKASEPLPKRNMMSSRLTPKSTRPRRPSTLSTRLPRSKTRSRH